MIRTMIVLRLAILGGLVLPGMAEGQDPRPTDPGPPPPVAIPTVQGTTASAEPASSAGGQGLPGRLGPVGSRPFEGLDRPAGVRWRYPIQGPHPQAGRSNFDTWEANYGLTLAPVDDTLRAQLGIESGQGVVIVEVKSGGLAEQAGLKVNDVLLSLGERPVTGVNQARSTFVGLGREAIEVKLIREGKHRRMSMVGPEHGFPPESSEFWIGVPVSPVDSTLRSHLADLPPDAGLIVNDVVKGSPADRSGVLKNDILVAMGGKPLKTADSLIEQVQASGGKPVPLTLLRAGKATTLEVMPAKRAHPTVINRGRPPGEDYFLYREVRPRVAVEVDPFSSWAFPLSPSTKYDPILVNPHHVEAAPLGEPSRPIAARAPIDIQLELYSGRAQGGVEGATARIEAQLKELSAKLEEVRKAVEGMRKAGVK